VAGCDFRLEKGSDQNPPEAAAEQPVAATSEAPLSPEGPAEPGGLAGAGGGVDAPTASPSATPTRPRKPTVAKTQKWVKIFSGPSDKDITPPKSRTSGSNTVELNATENEQIGTYVADGAGRTLYRFDNDTNKPPKSNCNGDCQKAWPPLLIKSPGKIFPKGIDPKILGYVERADGHCQVTINGWPVYYFIADAKPGDLNGQGVNGKWFAVNPEGGKTKPIPGFPPANGGGNANGGNSNGGNGGDGGDGGGANNGSTNNGSTNNDGNGSTNNDGNGSTSNGGNGSGNDGTNYGN
jgi:predicted lipoprotein with Yx(FWY)xxD motif